MGNAASRARFGSSIRLLRLLFLGTVLSFAVMGTPSIFGVSSTASAESAYGQTAYGTEQYAGTQTPPVRPPNTGFESVVQAATTQPVTFWGPVAAVAVAETGMGVIVRNRMKRKQEN